MHGYGVFWAYLSLKLQFRCKRSGFLCSRRLCCASYRAPSYRELCWIREDITTLLSKPGTREEFETGREAQANEVQRRRTRTLLRTGCNSKCQWLMWVLWPKDFELQRNSWRGGEVSKLIRWPTSWLSFSSVSLTTIFSISAITRHHHCPSADFTANPPIFLDWTLPTCRLHSPLVDLSVTELVWIPRGHSTDCGWPVDWPPNLFNPHHSQTCKFHSIVYAIWWNKIRNLPMWPWTCSAGF